MARQFYAAASQGETMMGNKLPEAGGWMEGFNYIFQGERGPASALSLDFQLLQLKNKFLF